MNKNFSYSESLRFERLSDIFTSNFRLTELYAAYLERCPELITADMMSALCESGELSVCDALPAILAQAFSLDVENNADDKKLYFDYIFPSVRVLDAKRYTENPYYKNVRLDNTVMGEWEIRREVYPAYRAFIAGDMELHEDFREIAPLGFFTEDFEFPAVLEGGNEWMTLTPVDLDTCDEAIDAAHGKVITFGLGLGYYAYMASMKDTVDSVTVIEKSKKVIELFKSVILPQFPNKDKIRIIEADAFEYAENVMPAEHYDLAFVDTWRDASDGAPMYKKMKALEHLSGDTRFLYWIENFLISRLRATRFARMRDDYQSGRLDLTLDEVYARLSDPLK